MYQQQCAAIFGIRYEHIQLNCELWIVNCVYCKLKCYALWFTLQALKEEEEREIKASRARFISVR